MVTYLGKTYGCAMEMAIGLIGGKWKGLILWQLAEKKVLRFGELRRIFPGLTQKMLTQQLRELERDGIVHREVYHQVPPKVEYSLTEIGQSLFPVLKKLNEWGIDFLKKGYADTGQ